MRGSGGRRGPRRTGARREEADAVKNCEGKGERIFILGGKVRLPHYADTVVETAGAVTVAFFSPFCGRRVVQGSCSRRSKTVSSGFWRSCPIFKIKKC
jgi:hypothetical protein